MDLRTLEPKEEKPEPIKVICESCGGTTYDDDINYCSICGKPVCSNCGTSFEGKIYCEDCWQKI